MFNNIGGKIKKLSKIICWVGIVVSIFLAVCMFFAAADAYSYEVGTCIGLGFAFLIGGTLMSWLSSLFAYGFGELIEKTTEIANNTKK